MSVFSGLIVGLGNPGTQYASTRHNYGFLCVDALLEYAKKNNFDCTEQSGQKFKCELFRVKLWNNKQYLIAKPMTFMNLSGESVQMLSAWHKIEPEKIIVMHDELDIPLNSIRFKIGGGNAGHNGLASITSLLGTPNFARLRLGIGRSKFAKTNDWVLGKFTNEEFNVLDKMYEPCIETIKTYYEKGKEQATRYANEISKKNIALENEKKAS